jgi:hypothetical protein
MPKSTGFNHRGGMACQESKLTRTNRSSARITTGLGGLDYLAGSGRNCTDFGIFGVILNAFRAFETCFLGRQKNVLLTGMQSPAFSTVRFPLLSARPAGWS